MKSRKPVERREFSAEFKTEAVRMVEERRAAGGTLAQIGRELDVRPDQLRAWAPQQREAKAGGSGLPGETLEQENRRLRQENANLRQEQAFASPRKAPSLHSLPSNEQRSPGVSPGVRTTIFVAAARWPHCRRTQPVSAEAPSDLRPGVKFHTEVFDLREAEAHL